MDARIGLAESGGRRRQPRVGQYRLHQIRAIIESVLASAPIYLPSRANDFRLPEVRKYLDPHVRRSNGCGRRTA